MDWLAKAKEAKDKAVKDRIRQLFLQPIFNGTSIDLQYHKFSLDRELYSDKQLEVLRKSGVPDDIRGKWPDWGSLRPRELRIHGVVINVTKHRPGKADASVRRFIATGASTPKGELHNQITTLNLMTVRGLITPLQYCSWLSVEHLYKSSLLARLDHVNKTLSLATPLSWGPAVGFEVHDCIGWKREE